MGKFFFELYKALSQCQTLFNSQMNPNYYKTYTINFGLTDEQKKRVEELSEESITEDSKKIPFDQLKAKVKETSTLFSNEFDQSKIQMVDGQIGRASCRERV